MASILFSGESDVVMLWLNHDLEDTISAQEIWKTSIDDADDLDGTLSRALRSWRFLK